MNVATTYSRCCACHQFELDSADAHHAATRSGERQDSADAPWMARVIDESDHGEIALDVDGEGRQSVGKGSTVAVLEVGQDLSAVNVGEPGGGCFHRVNGGPARHGVWDSDQGPRLALDLRGDGRARTNQSGLPKTDKQAGIARGS